MKSSPTTQEHINSLLRQLRSEQYDALMQQPVDWDKVDRLGKRILALEIHRHRSKPSTTKDLVDLVRLPE